MEGVVVEQDDSSDCRIYPTVIFAKGDWPMLRKMGFLERHHGRSLAQDNRGKGICHLCMAGVGDLCDWHDSFSGSWLGTDSVAGGLVPPWNRESPVTRLMPQSPNLEDRVWFYRPDLFHTLHKGLLAELAGSAIALWLFNSSLFFSTASC